MKKVLITGAHGDIGSQLLLFLNTRNISTIEPARDRKYDLFDITNLHKLIHQATDTIHLAAVLNNLSAPKIERAKMLCVNSLLTAIIAKLIHREKEKKRFIYMSSEMVYQVEDNVVNDWIHTAVTKFDNFLAKNLQDQNIYKTNFDKICLKFCLSFLKRNPASARINFYSLTKLLAEKFVLQLDNSVILRLTNIYGPGYKKDRKIPRLIKAKLFGNCIHEKNDLRDYVYVSDLNQIIRKLLENNNYSIKGIFDFASRNRILTAEVVKIINKYLPIQYGEIVLEKSKHLALQKRAIKNIFDVLQIVPFDFTAGIQETITFFQATTDYRKKVSCYLPIKEIIGSDEKMIKVFRGGSCSYTLLITDANKRKFVRKVALREGVEGNGLSKLRKEIHYLKHIEEHEPELYRHYSTMRSHKLNEHFVSYDMDYIGTGTNLYRALKNDLSIDIFFLYFEKFISAIIKNGYLKKIEKINSVEAQEIFRSIIVNRALGRSENLFNYYAFRENEETLNKEDKLFQKIIDKLQKTHCYKWANIPKSKSHTKKNRCKF